MSITEAFVVPVVSWVVATLNGGSPFTRFSAVAGRITPVRTAGATAGDELLTATFLAPAKTLAATVGFKIAPEVDCAATLSKGANSDTAAFSCVCFTAIGFARETTLARSFPPKMPAEPRIMLLTSA